MAQLGVVKLEETIKASDYKPSKIKSFKPGGRSYVLSTSYDDFYKSLWEFNNELYNYQLIIK